MLAALASIMLAGCSNDDSVSDSKVNKDQLSVVVGGIGTKAIKTSPNFLPNDEIGVFIYGVGYAPTIKKYTYKISSAWEPSAGDISLTGNNATAYAFYPSNILTVAENGDTTFPVSIPPTDDLVATGAIDYLWAKSLNDVNNNSTNQAVFNFHHSLAKISFVFVSDGQYPVTNGSGKLKDITLNSAGHKLAISGTVKVGDGTFTPLTYGDKVVYTAPSGSESVINASEVAANDRVANAYAMVAPINYTAGDFTLTATIDGKVMTVSGFDSKPNWSDASKNYEYTITVSPAALAVSSSTVILGWGTAPVAGTITAK